MLIYFRVYIDKFNDLMMLITNQDVTPMPFFLVGPKLTAKADNQGARFDYQPPQNNL